MTLVGMRSRKLETAPLIRNSRGIRFRQKVDNPRRDAAGNVNAAAGAKGEREIAGDRAEHAQNVSSAMRLAAFSRKPGW